MTYVYSLQQPKLNRVELLELYDLMATRWAMKAEKLQKKRLRKFKK